VSALTLKFERSSTHSAPSLLSVYLPLYSAGIQKMTPFMLISYVLVLALLDSLAVVHAVPMKVTLRDVIAPPITYPIAGVVWIAGSEQTVTWDTSVIPTGEGSVTNPIGELVLGWLDSTGENLQLNDPIKQNIPLVDGETAITVPDVPEQDNYILCLLGDSGNISGMFTIKGGQGSMVSPQRRHL